MNKPSSSSSSSPPLSSSSQLKNIIVNHSTTNSNFDKHKALIDIYKNGALSINDDIEVFRSSHQFVRDDEEDAEKLSIDWKYRMARRYYNKLYKEYAIVDLNLYLENKIGMRWRTETEVINGKGQFSCASKYCFNDLNLHSYEVPFKYKENSIIKHELVKTRVCIDCAYKLFYNKLNDLKKKEKKRKRTKSDNSNIDTTNNDITNPISSHKEIKEKLNINISKSNKKSKTDDNFEGLLL
jgi:protein FRA10AC1